MSRRGAGALTLVLLLVACSGGGDDPSPATTTTSTLVTSTRAPTTTAPVEEVVFDWAAPTTLELPGGWTVAPCGGDAPLACVAEAGAQAGVVEQLGFPLDSLPDLEEALAGGTSPDVALELFAIDERETLEADRRTGCDPDFEVRLIGPEPATVAGQPGVRYGLEGVDGTGAVVERISKHALLTENALFLVVASALEPDGCLSPEGDFRVATLERFEPQLARLAAGSRFPPPAEPGP